MDNFATGNFERINFGILLGQTNALKDRLLARHLILRGITVAQLKVLMIIRRSDNTATSLCRHLSIHSASMTRMLDRLEGKGLIVRGQDAQDRRQVRLMLTNKGETLRSIFPVMEAAAMNEFTECLTTEELKNLERLLKKMVGTEFSRIP
ncbi:MarR family winged helix-turn-helix transcriptional regulator [Pseudomonas yamanorum]|uniref:MarR family transcriptional regulator n=1 Tax=Pseudomonas yamanorum TaxID=515393 RepID=A0A7Y8FF86_9PSED|nr:MarR family transcriptional regulator [Pseudomonas yamanorum]NWE77813.1 MarR family transcriptional regulator [Pseudomonas yamanorum]